MSIVTPSETAAGYLAQFTIGQQRYDITEQSDASGHTATRLGAPPRWRLSFRTLDALPPAISGLWKAIALQLKGRINHLGMWDVTHPEPAGTARGTLITSGTTAVGATTVAITGALGVNRLLNGSFEVDSNADGLADHWTRYSAGTVGALSHSLSSGTVWGGAYSQNLVAASLGATSADRQGVTAALINASDLAGGAAVASCRVLGTSGSVFSLEVYWRDITTAIIGSAISTPLTMDGLEQSVSVTGSVPAGTVTADIFAYQHSGPGGAVGLYIDIVRVEAGSTAGTGGEGTILAGDWLQIGTGVGTSHYCMATSDATANDAGAITVTFQPPTRISFAGATAVTWDKPLCYYRQAADVSQWSGAAGSTDVGGFAFDLVENWRA